MNIELSYQFKDTQQDLFQHTTQCLLMRIVLPSPKPSTTAPHLEVLLLGLQHYAYPLLNKEVNVTIHC